MIFLIRPVSTTADAYEKIASEYAVDLRARYQNKEYTDFHDCENENNPVEYFKQKIREWEDEAYFVAYTHGSNDSLILTPYGEIFGIGDCVLLKNKYCYLVACHAMNRFGPELINSGAKAVLGYKGEFWTYINQNDPDNIKKFKKCINNGIIIFLEDAKDIKKTFKEIKNLYIEFKREIEERTSTTEREIWLLGLISWNSSKLDFLPKQ